LEELEGPNLRLKFPLEALVFIPTVKPGVPTPFLSSSFPAAHTAMSARIQKGISFSVSSARGTGQVNKVLTQGPEKVTERSSSPLIVKKEETEDVLALEIPFRIPS
jgi:hypothetical protein